MLVFSYGLIILAACYLLSVCVPSIRRDRWRWYNYITRDLGHCFAESQETTRVTSVDRNNTKIAIWINNFWGKILKRKIVNAKLGSIYIKKYIEVHSILKHVSSLISAWKDIFLKCLLMLQAILKYSLVGMRDGKCFCYFLTIVVMCCCNNAVMNSQDNTNYP